MNVGRIIGDNFSYKAVQQLYKDSTDKLQEVGSKLSKFDFEADRLSNEVKVLEMHINGIERAEKEIQRLSKGIFGSLKERYKINELKDMVQYHTQELQNKGFSKAAMAKVQMRSDNSNLEQLNLEKMAVTSEFTAIENRLKPVEECLKALKYQAKMIENESQVVGTISVNELKRAGKEVDFQEISMADYKKLLKTDLKFDAMQRENGSIGIAIDKKDAAAVKSFLSRNRALER